MPALILASASVYRTRLLERLGLAFACETPDIDESPLPGEPAQELVLRLSRAKARAIAARRPDTLIIASDQVGDSEGRILGKPGTVERACEQLRSIAGREVRFLTGLCVLDAASGRELAAVETCTVHLRALDATAVHDYVARELPLDCAGSFRIEGLGIALFESVQLDDPTVLEGLPLIRVVEFLGRMGMPVLAQR